MKNITRGSETIKQKSNKRLDLTGRKMGKLLVIKEGKKRQGKGRSFRTWHCLCECGKKSQVDGFHLTSGHTKTCGCSLHDGSRRKRHGFSQSDDKLERLFYERFKAAKQRCSNPLNKNYKNYGGRGIKWLWLSFEDFKNDMWDPFNRHIKEYGLKQTQLDRINNEEGYSKDNCRWATIVQNMNNTRVVRLITIGEEVFSLSQWAKKCKVPITTFFHRLRRGETPEQALRLLKT